MPCFLKLSLYVDLYMKKIQRANEERPKHVLAILREVIGCSQKSAPEDLGIPPDTCASIESGRVRKGRPTYKITEAVARRVALQTGISPDWLLNGNTKAPMTTMDGKPFTRDVFERVRHELESVIVPVRTKGNECFSLYLRLCIHLGKVMLAAADANDAKFAAWKLRDEIHKIGKKYPAFGEQVAGTMKNQTVPETFSMELQIMLNTGTAPKKVWTSTLDRFHKGLCTTESKQAQAAASKPKIKRAKPPRR
jgi:hypothetical protein